MLPKLIRVEQCSDLACEFCFQKSPYKIGESNQNFWVMEHCSAHYESLKRKQELFIALAYLQGKCNVYIWISMSFLTARMPSTWHLYTNLLIESWPRVASTLDFEFELRNQIFNMPQVHCLLNYSKLKAFQH